MTLKKKVALVTGSGRGIGRGIAVALAQAGWTVVVNAVCNATAAKTTLEMVRAADAEGIVVLADVAAETDRERLVQAALDAFGQIDLLVNNAGMAPRQRLDLLDVSEASMAEVLGVNLIGPFFLTQRVAKIMIDLTAKNITVAPKIINIGSISAYTSSPNRPEYCLSKAGVGMMTKLFAHRLAQEGIAVYEIRPGLIETDMTTGVHEKYAQLIADGLTPIQRWGQPEDVGKAVVAIAEGCFPFSTGQVIDVDGGFHLQRL